MSYQYLTGFPDKQESYRLAELHQYNILDSASEEDYNDIARLASRICEAPIAFISFLSADRQWMKSCIGVEVTELPRTQSFCQYAIEQPNEMMVVEDLSKHSRFSTHPFVAGEPHLAFYAGMPLTNKQGYALGTLCVLDMEPRSLTARQFKALKLFSIQLMHMLELRRIQHEHDALQTKLQDSHRADEHIQSVTAQIRRSLFNVVAEAPKWANWHKREDSSIPACEEGAGRMEIDIKSLIEKMLTHYPQK